MDSYLPHWVTFLWSVIAVVVGLVAYHMLFGA